jgi:hypothetical protein
LALLDDERLLTDRDRERRYSGAQKDSRRAKSGNTVTFAFVPRTPVAILGHPNVEIALRREWVLGYLRALPRAMIAAFEGAPWALPIGLALVAFFSLRAKRLAPIVAYGALFVVESWIYALTPFGAAIDHHLQSWALSRYALIWLLVPTYFAAAGIAHAWKWTAEQWKPAAYVGALPICALALSSSSNLARLHGYQHEYRFLRRELKSVPDDVPLVVVWQKGKGIDYCESLAAPHYGYTEETPRRDVYVLPMSIALRDYFDRLPARFVYFRDVLTQVDTTALGAFPLETRSSLEEAQRTDCVLRGGELLRVRRDVPLMYIQLAVPRQTADLELRLVDREQARARFDQCSGMAKQP